MTEREAFFVAHGELLRQLRGERSQGEVARVAQISQSMLSRIELGSPVNLWEHRCLASACGLTAAELLTRLHDALARLQETAGPAWWTTDDPEALRGLVRYVVRSGPRPGSAAMGPDNCPDNCPDNLQALPGQEKPPVANQGENNGRLVEAEEILNIVCQALDDGGPDDWESALRLLHYMLAPPR